VSDASAATRPAEPPFRLRATDRPPLGLVFAACGAVAGAVVLLLHLDRLPFAFCAFRQLTGLPCPTCGGTRALGRLAALDLRGAFAMNPLAVGLGLVVALWAVSDIVLLPRRQSLRLAVRPDAVFAVRVAVVVTAAANWAYLVLAGR
jgi:Protein of unknown function (DUF2752)